MTVAFLVLAWWVGFLLGFVTCALFSINAPSDE